MREEEKEGGGMCEEMVESKIEKRGRENSAGLATFVTSVCVRGLDHHDSDAERSAKRCQISQGYF